MYTFQARTIIFSTAKFWKYWARFLQNFLENNARHKSFLENNARVFQKILPYMRAAPKIFWKILPNKKRHAI